MGEGYNGGGFLGLTRGKLDYINDEGIGKKGKRENRPKNP